MNNEKTKSIHIYRFTLKVVDSFVEMKTTKRIEKLLQDFQVICNKKKLVQII